MSNTTNIQWTNRTWTAITGCRRISPGCENCYALRDTATRLRHLPKYEKLAVITPSGPRWTGEVRLCEETLEEPLRWKTPNKVFVCDMSDLFYEEVPADWIDRVFAVMALAESQTFQVLTKRARRMRDYLSDPNTPLRVQQAAEAYRQKYPRRAGVEVRRFPLRNLWLGVSAENQRWADERIPLLLETPAAIRFVSVEPLLGPVDLSRYLDGEKNAPCLDWVIVGGESGPKGRTCQVEWVRSLVGQCRTASVACFVKQLGAKAMQPDGPLRLKDRKGGDPSEWPADVRVREFPSRSGEGGRSSGRGQRKVLPE